MRCASSSRAGTGRGTSLVEPGHLQLVAMTAPGSGHHAAMDDQVGAVGREGSPWRREQPAVGGAGTEDPRVVPGQQAHGVGCLGGVQQVQVGGQRVAIQPVDAHRGHPVAEASDPLHESASRDPESLDQPVPEVVERRRTVAAQVQLHGRGTRHGDLGKARPARVVEEEPHRGLTAASGPEADVTPPEERLVQGVGPHAHRRRLRGGASAGIPRRCAAISSRVAGPADSGLLHRCTQRPPVRQGEACLPLVATRLPRTRDGAARQQRLPRRRG